MAELEANLRPDGTPVSVRERLAEHRRNPAGASCHDLLDPPGFALENFDGIGQWRTRDAGDPIDASGKLPDGTDFQGPAGLRRLLLTKYRDDFVRTATEKLLTYALGRGVDYEDYPAIRSINRQAARENEEHERSASEAAALVSEAQLEAVREGFRAARGSSAG